MKWLLSLFICVQCLGLEMLVEARNRALSDEEKPGRAARGMIVVVKPDGWTWGNLETLPRYVVIKMPGVSPAAAKKYVQAHYDGDNKLNYRLWRIRWEDLPLAARNKLASGEGLTIKVGDYAGTYDFTWTQVKTYIRNLATGLDETEDL